MDRSSFNEKSRTKACRTSYRYVERQRTSASSEVWLQTSEEAVDQYVMNGLPSAKATALVLHARECPRCAAKIEDARAFIELLRGAAYPDNYRHTEIATLRTMLI